MMPAGSSGPPGGLTSGAAGQWLQAYIYIPPHLNTQHLHSRPPGPEQVADSED